MCAPTRAAIVSSEWHTLFPSPTYANFRPRNPPKRSSSVKKSDSAWHGWKRSESALITGMRPCSARPSRDSCENTRDDSVNHSLEIFRYVANGFARPKPCCRMVEKHRRTAEARNTHFKGHTGAQRRFFENHRQKFSFESAAIAIRPRFDVRRQVEEFAHLRGSPFHSGQEIVSEC